MNARSDVENRLAAVFTTDAETVIESARGTAPASRDWEVRSIGADNLRIRQPKLFDR